PVSAPPKVKPPAPVPATVVVAVSVAGDDSTMFPAPATATAGLVPVKLSGLPATVTVPVPLLIVRALRSNALPVAPMSLVAVYVAACVAAAPKVRAVVDPGAGGAPSCQFDPAGQLPPAGLLQVYWARAGGAIVNSACNARVSVGRGRKRVIRRSPRLPPSPTGRGQICSAVPGPRPRGAGRPAARRPGAGPGRRGRASRPDRGRPASSGGASIPGGGRPAGPIPAVGRTPPGRPVTSPGLAAASGLVPCRRGDRPQRGSPHRRRRSARRTPSRRRASGRPGRRRPASGRTRYRAA